MILHPSSTFRTPDPCRGHAASSPAVPGTGEGRKYLSARSFSQRLAHSLPWMWGLWVHRPPSAGATRPGPSTSLASRTHAQLLAAAWAGGAQAWVTSQLCLRPLGGFCFCLSQGPIPAAGQRAHCPSAPEAHIAWPVPALGNGFSTKRPCVSHIRGCLLVPAGAWTQSRGEALAALPCLSDRS